MSRTQACVDCKNFRYGGDVSAPLVRMRYQKGLQDCRTCAAGVPPAVARCNGLTGAIDRSQCLGSDAFFYKVSNGQGHFPLQRAELIQKALSQRAAKALNSTEAWAAYKKQQPKGGGALGRPGPMAPLRSPPSLASLPHLLAFRPGLRGGRVASGSHLPAWHPTLAQPASRTRAGRARCGAPRAAGRRPSGARRRSLRL
jgi:hypothetical protein